MIEMNVQELLALVRTQAETIKRLEARIVELEAEVARLKKDSSNSSKPSCPKGFG
jgi:BMFP domain-containing protein YqiC